MRPDHKSNLKQLHKSLYGPEGDSDLTMAADYITKLETAARKLLAHRDTENIPTHHGLVYRTMVCRDDGDALAKLLGVAPYNDTQPQHGEWPY